MAADISCPRKDNGRRFLLLWFRIFYPAEENRLESDKEEGEVVDPSIHLSIYPCFILEDDGRHKNRVREEDGK